MPHQPWRYLAGTEGYMDFRTLPGKVGLWVSLETGRRSGLAQPVGLSWVVSGLVLYVLFLVFRDKVSP